MQIRTGRLPYLMAIGLTAVSLAACGDDDDSGSAASDTTEATTEQTQPKPSAGTTLDVDAVEQGPGQLAFSKKALQAKAGSVTVDMANPSGNQLPHAIEVEGGGVEEEGDTVQAGGTSSVTVDLEPGKYTFYCPVGDHEDQGMKGTLTVR